MSRLSLERAEFVAWMMKLDPKLAVEEAIKTERYLAARRHNRRPRARWNRMGERTR